MVAVESAVGKALSSVLQRVAAASQRAGRSKQPAVQARLVAVSKTKPVELLQDAYKSGHKTFGENYVQEIVDKAPVMPHDVRWHFIGHLQSNKVKTLLEGCPNLAMLETVDSVKLANKLSNTVEACGREPLPVLIQCVRTSGIIGSVQVNTSGEESKYGVTPDEAVTLATHIHEKCKNLKMAGLMTIGQPDYSSRPENFTCLTGVRQKVAEALQVDEESLELSMGMSGDFEQAVEMGSTNVRVGSTIFGARDYSNKA